MRSDNTRLSIIYALLAAFFYALLGALIKTSEQAASKEMIVFFRQSFGLIVLLPFIIREKPKLKLLKSDSFPLHLLRTFTSLASMFCLILAIRYLPLTNALLLSYTRPLFIPIVVFFWFRKKWSPVTWWGLCIGFLGVALILKPSVRCFDLGVVAGLFSGLFGAIAFTAIRRLTKTDSANAILLMYLALSIPIAAVTLITNWKHITGMDWLLLACIGFVGTVYQMMLTRAYQHAKAFKVASLLYSTVIFAAGFDYFFGTFSLDILSLIGMLLIIVGTIVTVRQRVKPFPPEGQQSKKK